MARASSLKGAKLHIRVGPNGEIALPASVRERFGLRPDSHVRVLETRVGILLVPLADARLQPRLAQELGAWQHLGASAWDLFGYDADQ